MLSCGEGPETYTDLPYKMLNGAIQKSGRDWVQKSGPGPQHYLHRQWEPLKIAFVQTEKLVPCCLAWGRGACDCCLCRFHKDKLKAGPTAAQNDSARWLRCRDASSWGQAGEMGQESPASKCGFSCPRCSVHCLLDKFA